MTARTLAAWMRRNLTVPSGDRAGRPWTVPAWQMAALERIASGGPDLALTMARGNGKTSFCSTLAAMHVAPDGPLHGRGAEVLIVASSREQARICWSDARSLLAARNGGKLPRAEWRELNSPHRCELAHRASGARIAALGSDPARLHGLRPTLVLADEPAQWPGGLSDRMHAALRTSLGKRPGSRLIALGTRPAGAHWFERLLGQPASLTFAAPRGCDLLDETAWRAANPSWAILGSLRARIRREAAEAAADETLAPSFRALRLNDGSSDHSQGVLLSPDTWASIERPEGAAAEIGAGCLWGIDLGSVSAMSAVSAYDATTGALACLAAFPDRPPLDERARADRAGELYRLCADRGELILTRGRTVQPADLLRAALSVFPRPAAVVADRWREGELRDALDMAGVPPGGFQARGMGFKDGAADVRLFRGACLAGRVRPARSLLLAAAMSEARTISDPAGNEKLAKGGQGGRRHRARDDAAAAAILAVAAGERARQGRAGSPPGRPPRRSFLVRAA